MRSRSTVELVNRSESWFFKKNELDKPARANAHERADGNAPGEGRIRAQPRPLERGRAVQTALLMRLK